MITIKENLPCVPNGETIKALLAPVNICGQAYHLAKALRENGIYARSFQYTINHHKYPYDLYLEKKVFEHYKRQEVMLDVTRQFLEADYDIIQFFQKTLIFNVNFRDFTGIDLPLFKEAGKKIIFRFTGWDLRREQDNLRWNRFSAFRYGYKLTSYQDDKSRRIWLDYLRNYVDAFIVVDEEMQQFCPEAKVVPRVLPLDEWSYVGVTPTKVPLLLHAPTDPEFKGTRFFRRAIEDLKFEGLKFRYQEVSKLPNEELKQLMSQADIYLDQLHLGWYGVAAIEAMALGKPVVNYIRDDLESNFGEKLPIYNVNVDNLKVKLRALIKDFELRNALSTAGRDFVVKHHDSTKVIHKLTDIYTRAVAPKTACEQKLIQSAHSLDWLSLQIQNKRTNNNEFLKAFELDENSIWHLQYFRLYEYFIFRYASKIQRKMAFLQRSRWGRPLFNLMKKIYHYFKSKNVIRNTKILNKV